MPNISFEKKLFNALKYGQVKPKSIYDMWLDLGNEGTVEEFIESLRGLQGETGAQGPKGDTGATGTTGANGKDGVSITSVTQTTTSTTDGGDNIITIALSNGTTNTFKVKNGTKGSQGIQGPKGDKGDPASSKLSELTNDAGFITNTVTNLVNYYTKSQSYTKDEINNLITLIPKFAVTVVPSLPTSDISTTTIYLIKDGSETGNLYIEYIYVNGAWQELGKQTLNLTNYLTKTGDTANNVTAFTSADSTTANSWTNVNQLTTGEKHSSIFNKISTMFKNIRFLYKMLGTTDISTIGGGTVTGAINTLNTNVNNLSKKTLINGWVGQITSPITYQLENYGSAYLIMVSGVGNGQIYAVDAYAVCTAISTTGNGYIVRLNNSDNIHTNITLTLNVDVLTITAPNNEYWANIAIYKL